MGGAQMDNFFGWAGLVVGILGILAGVITYWLQRRYKRLDYEIRTDQDLISQTTFEDGGDLQVTYRGNLVRNPRFVVVRLINTGKSEISEADFERPLKLSIPSWSKLVSVDVSDHHPEALSPVVKLTGAHAMEMEPLLLNAGDWIEVRLLIDGAESDLQVHGRIAGIRTINNLKPHRTARQKAARRILPAYAALVVILLIWMFVSSILERN
jgi:protein-S-isoprenylcysteine O-methyltransferase Ste14